MRKNNMHFSSKTIRPPFEARSISLQVTSGCSHNKCDFCNYYNNIPFNISTYEEIIEDLKELKDKRISYNRIWLQSADAFTIKCDRLRTIANLIHEHLPYINSIGCYSRINSLNNKSVHQLNQLNKLGYDSIVFGTESGDDYLLKYMNKGYQSRDILRQIRKMDKSNMKYTLIFLNGMGGHDYGLTHAIKTTSVFNKLNPERIMINRLNIHEDTTLYNKVNNNQFKTATPEECIRELISFIDNLEIDTFIDATNDTNIIPFFGKTGNKKSIIEKLEHHLEKKNDS
jgi:radical SAM superfamily enzyme YgiQ (UPF0313 family)